MRFIVLLLLGYCAYLFFKNRASKELPPAAPPKGEETHMDPVCGVYVAEEDAVIGRIEDTRVYFCSMACLEKYREQLENKQVS